ncbi:MAG: DUF4340 domain-containing protein [Vicinamibacteria bacterium]|nr:DUF4340 domain-containing protein [Vicinamibacteria bacterium]
MSSFARTAFAVAIAASLFGYIYFVESKKDPKSETPDEGSGKREKVFTGFDKLKVKSLTLKKRGGDLVEVEKNGESWALVSPREIPADAGEIATLLDALQGLETEDVLSEGASDLAPFGLSEPRVAVSVVAEGAPKPFEFELGDSVPAGFSLFARVPGKPQLFTVSSTLENTLSKSAFDLRDRRLIKVKKADIRSVAVVEKGKNAFKLVRGAPGEDEWKVETPVTTRAARWTVDSFLGLIENLRMESIVTEQAAPPDLAKHGLGATARRLILGLDESKSLTLEIGKKTDDGKYYAREGTSKLVATISAALADDLDKGLKNLRATRLLDVAAYEVTAFDVASGGVTKTFTKSTTKEKDGVEEVLWKAAAPAKDASQQKASDALFAIGGLDAAEFIDAPKNLSAYGLDSPALRVTLKFDGDKKADWFEVALKGEEAFGRRRDDSSIIRLDKTKAEALITSFTALGS